MKERMLVLSLFAFLFISTAGFAFTPLTGHWNNLGESGSGYNIDIQNGILVVTVYSYKASGEPQWYIASGPMSSDQRSFSGTLLMYSNGQCISCMYSGSPTPSGTAGTINITFLSETSATLTLPGGRVTNIQPFNFGYGNPPQGLIGEWIFVYDIISGSTTFAERFNLTVLGGSTSTGTGTVMDLTRAAVCEYQYTGSFAGHVLCFDFDSISSTAKVQNQYLFQFGLGETFDGFWISPTTYNQYSMKGLRTESRTGVNRMAATSTSEATYANSFSSQKWAEDSVNMSGQPMPPSTAERSAAIAKAGAEMLQVIQHLRLQ
jgi:hypothetical protein